MQQHHSSCGRAPPTANNEHNPRAPRRCPPSEFISLANKRKLKETLRTQQYSAMAQVQLSAGRLEAAINLADTKEAMTANNDAIGDTDALVDEFEDAKAASLAHGTNIDSAFAGLAVDQEDATDEWENGPQVLMPDGSTHNPVKAAAATIAAGSASAAAVAAGGASSLSYPSSYPAVAPYAVGTAPVALPARARSPARAPALPQPAEDSAEAEWNA